MRPTTAGSGGRPKPAERDGRGTFGATTSLIALARSQAPSSRPRRLRALHADYFATEWRALSTRRRGAWLTLGVAGGTLTGIYVAALLTPSAAGCTWRSGRSS